MAAATNNCPSCGSDLSTGARFCATCGRRVAPRSGEISWEIADRRYFGVLPGGRVLRAARIRLIRILALVRARFSQAVAVVAARAANELARLRARPQAAALVAERTGQLQRLGEAVYRNDRKEAKEAKARVAALDARLAAKEEEMRALEAQTQERIEQVRRQSGATQAVELPPTVPEPEPVPHEPPGPVIVPEPQPTEPPGPVIVPEPQPTEPE